MNFQFQCKLNISRMIPFMVTLACRISPQQKYQRTLIFILL